MRSPLAEKKNATFLCDKGDLSCHRKKRLSPVITRAAGGERESGLIKVLSTSRGDGRIWVCSPTQILRCVVDGREGGGSTRQARWMGRRRGLQKKPWGNKPSKGGVLSSGDRCTLADLIRKVGREFLHF